MAEFVNNGKQRKCNDTNVGIDNQLFEPVLSCKHQEKPSSTQFPNYGIKWLALPKLKLHQLMLSSNISSVTNACLQAIVY